MTPHPIAYLALPRHLALLAGLALFSGIIVRIMISIGVPDHPDPRKAHSKTTPKSGGVGIVAAFLLGFVLLYLYGRVSRIAEPYFLGVIAAACLIAIVAFLDDLYDFPFIVKLAAQLLAAAAAVGAGLTARRFAIPYVGTIDLGIAGPALTMGWIVFVTNAMNFIDGMNGLAPGTALVACLFLSFIAALHGSFFVYTASLLLAGGLIGFLPFNYPQARIFMGDVGSQFCGFMLALLGIAATHYETTPLSFLIVPLLLCGVLFDVSFTLLRRLLNGENIARPHRSHLYQIAARAGMDPRLVAALYWGFALIGGLTSLAFIAAPSPAKPFIIFAPLIPLLAWLVIVLVRARRAGLTDWSS
jgi:UDP-GlcNAc:undecaprenyl-phosphate GlcNAc-1-phosphate transferase